MYGMIATRRYDICPAEICKTAKIARSTFYAHYSNKNFIEQHELRLVAKFLARLPGFNPQKIVIFTILLSFVREEREYFEATIPNANFWLLKQIFAELYPILKAKDCSRKSYDFYAMQQIALISCWAKYNKCAIEKLELYARKMMAVPMMHVET